jgi:hypothetical protein
MMIRSDQDIISSLTNRISVGRRLQREESKQARKDRDPPMTRSLWRRASDSSAKPHWDRRPPRP